MRKTHKLLAVVMWLGSAQANADTPRTLASGAPACGNTMGKKGPSESCRAELTLYRATEDLERAQQNVLEAKAKEVAYESIYVGTPRRLANGAPACSNVMAKGEKQPPCTAEIADQEDAVRLFRMKDAFVATREFRQRAHEAAQRVASLRIAVEAVSERGSRVARR